MLPGQHMPLDTAHTPPHPSLLPPSRSWARSLCLLSFTELDFQSGLSSNEFIFCMSNDTIICIKCKFSSQVPDVENVYFFCKWFCLVSKYFRSWLKTESRPSIYPSIHHSIQYPSIHPPIIQSLYGPEGIHRVTSLHNPRRSLHTAQHTDGSLYSSCSCMWQPRL